MEVPLFKAKICLTLLPIRRIKAKILKMDI